MSSCTVVHLASHHILNVPSICFISEPDMTKRYLGKFRNYFHGISGNIYALGTKRLLVEDFKYDGTGPDAFFWAGTEGLKPGPEGILLAHPFRGKFYDYEDFDAPVLKRFEGETVILTLPENVQVGDLKWISVWCRQFAINFGDFIIGGTSSSSNEIFDIVQTTTSERCK